jgi:hypothetical protein
MRKPTRIELIGLIVCSPLLLALAIVIAPLYLLGKAVEYLDEVLP